MHLATSLATWCCLATNQFSCQTPCKSVAGGRPWRRAHPTTIGGVATVKDLDGKTFSKVGRHEQWPMSLALPERQCIVIDAGVKRQIVNQVEGHSEICTKTRLAENLRRYANEQKLDCCWVPETFVVSAGYNEGVVCMKT